MPAYLVELHRSGPAWQPSVHSDEQIAWPEHAAFMVALLDSGFILIGGPLADEFRVVMAVEADSEEDVRAVLAQDPWSGSHLLVVSVEPWNLRLDLRNRQFLDLVDPP
jgi:uncharacterized protein YciI